MGDKKTAKKFLRCVHDEISSGSLPKPLCNCFEHRIIRKGTKIDLGQVITSSGKRGLNWWYVVNIAISMFLKPLRYYQKFSAYVERRGKRFEYASSWWVSLIVIEKTSSLMNILMGETKSKRIFASYLPQPISFFQELLSLMRGVWDKMPNNGGWWINGAYYLFVAVSPKRLRTLSNSHFYTLWIRGPYVHSNLTIALCFQLREIAIICRNFVLLLLHGVFLKETLAKL